MSIEQQCPWRIVIVGGGFSGAALARALVEQSSGPLVLTIVEPRHELGAGLAYSTKETGHLLNGPAAVFSLYADRPSHFVDWLHANLGPEAVRAWQDEDDIFAPRSVYGRYVGDALKSTLQRHGDRVAFRHVQARAATLRFGAAKAVVVVEDGREFVADHVVLANGVAPARPAFEIEALRQDPRYVADPWDVEAYQALKQAEHLAIIGSGLTMLDSLVTLDRVGFKGRVEVISRRGLQVWARRAAAAWANVFDSDKLPTSAREALRAAKDARRQIETAGADWQSLPLAVVPFAARIWAGADDDERRRYLRHLRPYWETTRHRAAPPTGRLAEAWRSEGRLRQRAARIERVEAAPEKLTVTLRARGSIALEALEVDGVIVCAGAEYTLSKAAPHHPFLAALLKAGIIRPGPVSFGLDAERNGTVRDAGGRLNHRLSAIGPLLRGVHWESNALPEILPQVAALAGRLAAEAGQAAVQAA